MPNDQDLEKQEHPKLDEQQDNDQRGGDPEHPHEPDEPRKPDVDPAKRKQVEGFFLERRKSQSRQDGFWPYLLIRAFVGDYGKRNPPLNVFWESPDVLVVPGIVDTLDGHTPTLHPAIGVDHTIFVRVWNLGKLAAIGAKLRVWWANPSFSFDDPNSAEHPHYIGGTYLNLPDCYDPLCHQVIRIPSPWRPIDENGGHECLLVRIECFADTASGTFAANVDRHVGQRNLDLVAPDVDLTPLFAQLSESVPFRANLQLLHGMADVRAIVLAQGQDFADRARVRVPLNVPAVGQPIAGGIAGHLGAAARTPEGTVFVPPSVMARTFEPHLASGIFRPGDITSDELEHPDTARIAPDVPIAQAVLHDLALPDLRAGTIAAQLSAGRTGETHMLRFQATREGKVVGGYTVIVQS